MPSELGLLLVILLILANAFFVATEFAIVAVRRSRLEELASQGNLNAKAAIDVVSHLDTYIAAVQLGITMASLTLGWIGEPALADTIRPTIEKVAGSHASTVAHSISIVIAFTLITALHIIVGELAPKGLALQRTEKTALFVARPIQLFYSVFRWPTQFLNKTGNLMLRIVGLKPASSVEMAHSVTELQLLLKGMEKEGVVGDKEVDYVSRVFRIAHREVREIMTPRTDIVYLDKNMTIRRFLEFNAHQTFSFFPVFDGNRDNIIGILAVKDLLHALGNALVTEDDPVNRAVHPAYFVPETKRAIDLVDEMRLGDQTIALVVDEFGEVSGLITFKQLLGEIVGQIRQEGAPEPVQKLSNGTLQVDGVMRITEANQRLSLNIPESDEYNTIAGLILAKLGHIPQKGECIYLSGFKLEVNEVHGTRIVKVNIMQNCASDTDNSDISI